MIMASTAIRAPTCLCSSSPSSTTITRPTIFNNLSSSLTFQSKRFNLCALFPPKGLCGHCSPWSGLKHLGLSISWTSSKLERKRCRDGVAYASLFGVGAPEALVIGVVALLVFGPKGLAEVARSLGKTLRAFQPTIKELQEVSREFKSTLEKEIGLDEISSSTPRAQNYNTSSTSTSSPVSTTEETKIAADPNGTSSTDGAYTSEELLKVTEEQLKASATKQQEQTSPQSEIPHEAQASPQDSGSLSSEASTAAEPNVAGSDVQQKELTSSQASTAKENAG